MPALISRRFPGLLAGIVLIAAVLRGAFPTADPPWRTTVGVVWHDEGAWVHNARNRALFGAWRVDEWNPLFIAPVFTGFEYLSFRTFGVGLWQARVVSEVAGVISVVLLSLGVRRLAGDLAAIIAAALLATNYVYVMYDRAAIMEALMVAFVVGAWYCSTRAEDRPWWGGLAGVLAILAYFTKAAAIFYVAAVGVAALWTLVDSSVRADRDRVAERQAAFWTIAGLGLSAAVVSAAFVLPHWSDYRFYNWQMSVTRKPSYDLASLIMRVSWFPILHDTFSRMWFEVVVGIVGTWGILLRWRRVTIGERLLLLWVVTAVVELLLHDVGNERRFVILIPAMVALTAIVLGRLGGLLPDEARAVSRLRLLMCAPLISVSRVHRLRSDRQAAVSLHGQAQRAVVSGAGSCAWPRGLRVVAAGQSIPERRTLEPGGGSARDPGTDGTRRGGVRPVGVRAQLQERQCVASAGSGAAARYPGAGQARQRPVARESDPPGVHRARVRQLHRSETAR